MTEKHEPPSADDSPPVPDPNERARLDRLSRAITEKINRNPDSADLHVQMGTIHLERGDRRPALDHLLTALELDPNRTDLIERIKRRFPEEEWRDVVFPERRRVFWENPGRFLTYPLAREGLIVIFSGAALFSMMGMVPITGFLLILLLAFPLMGAFMMNILRHAADGERDMPGWPDVQDLFDSILRPAFQLLFATLTAYIPAILLFLIGGRPDSFGTGKGMLLLALLAAGAVYAPAAVMAAALFNNVLAAFNFPLLVRSIIRIRKDYALSLAVLIGIFLLWGLSGFLVPAGIPFLGSLLSWMFVIYFVTLQMYMLGNLYHVHERVLHWL